MSNVVGYISKTLDADTVEKSVEINCKEILLIKNASGNTITLNFDNDTSEDNTIVLSANEKLENWGLFQLINYIINLQ